MWEQQVTYSIAQRGVVHSHAHFQLHHSMFNAVTWRVAAAGLLISLCKVLEETRRRGCQLLRNIKVQYNNLGVALNRCHQDKMAEGKRAAGAVKADVYTLIDSPRVVTPRVEGHLKVTAGTHSVFLHHP